MIPAHKVTSGSWTSRWGDWQIVLVDKGKHWFVAIYRWPYQASLEARSLMRQTSGLRSAEAAIGWATSCLKTFGAKVFIGGEEQPLVKFLAFAPAPEAVP